MAGLKVKETALLALLSAILLIGQIALGFLPNIEVVTLLIMVYSIVFRKRQCEDCLFNIFNLFIFLIFCFLPERTPLAEPPQVPYPYALSITA